MSLYQKLLATTKSRCCHSDEQIVLSRKGGYVTKNCLSCGRPSAIGLGQLPQLECVFCKRQMRIGKNDCGNYTYRCVSCQLNWPVHSLVPRFDNAGFVYDGFAIPQE